MSEHFESFEYLPDKAVSEDLINSAEIVAKPDRYDGEDLIKGKYKNVDFEVSDLTLTERVVVSTGKSTVVTYVDYFKGRWYVYKFKNTFQHKLKIVQGSSGFFSKRIKKI